MPLLDTLKSPEFLNGLGYALQQVGATGNPRMHAALQDRYTQELERKRHAEQYRGLLQNMELTPEQRGILGMVNPDQGAGLLAQRAFAEPERQIPGRDIPYSPEVLEQQLALRGRDGEGSGIDIGQVNPRDFTAPSIARFQETGNFEDLERFKPERTSKVDTATETLVVDNYSGQVIARYPKNLEAASAAKTEGIKVGEARANLPQVETDASRALQTIRTMRNHPGRKRAHGLASLVPARPGTPEYEFRRLHDQAKGEVFLNAYQRLKGGGHITEIETQQAEKALARLDLGLERGDYNKSLSDLERVIKAGLARERRKAKLGGSSPNVPRETAPDAGGWSAEEVR